MGTVTGTHRTLDAVCPVSRAGDSFLPCVYCYTVLSGGGTGHWTYSPSHSLPPAFLPVCLLKCQWLTFLQDASCQCSSSLPWSTLHNSLHSWSLGWRQRHAS